MVEGVCRPIVSVGPSLSASTSLCDGVPRGRPRRLCHHSGDDGQVDPKGPETGVEKTKKGGSFLCHHTYCYRWEGTPRLAFGLGDRAPL